ncbi:hypothetical protein Sgou_44470 [Streptomyces gougerotii]|uniref:VTT domain-containing protein n=1 Tax=Streptomyces gougerotii TaxID=53448 RepID=A0ABQ1DB48_9ACTN|nr:hypothetical protein Sgou_44470 [Streptomyces gougerotii]
MLICVAAIVGDQAGYLFGKKVGPALFKRPDSRLFKQENVTKANEFFEKHGPKSLVLARFVPIVRTFTPIIAGVSSMRYRSFITFNIVGGIVWGAGVTLLGAWLGRIAFVRENIEAMLILIVLISIVPIIIEFVKARGQSKRAAAAGPGAGPTRRPRRRSGAATPSADPAGLDEAGRPGPGRPARPVRGQKPRVRLAARRWPPPGRRAPAGRAAPSRPRGSPRWRWPWPARWRCSARRGRC